jgi:hypothetical protein
MSDHWMIVIPQDPLLRPTQERQNAILETLKLLRPETHGWEAQTSDDPIFFCCIENFENVFCPFCEAEITKFWGEAMDLWWVGDHRVLATTTPCCRRETSLNDLDYVLPQGFACFGVEMLRGGPDLEPDEREQVETALGAPVRIIWRRL